MYTSLYNKALCSILPNQFTYTDSGNDFICEMCGNFVSSQFSVNRNSPCNLSFTTCNFNYLDKWLRKTCCSFYCQLILTPMIRGVYSLPLIYLCCLLINDLSCSACRIYVLHKFACALLYSVMFFFTSPYVVCNRLSSWNIGQAWAANINT